MSESEPTPDEMRRRRLARLGTAAASGGATQSAESSSKIKDVLTELT